jgi:hypothetical protein
MALRERKLRSRRLRNRWLRNRWLRNQGRDDLLWSGRDIR